MSYKIMSDFIDLYLDKSAKLNIIDIGSYNVNGTYRDLFARDNWTYTGLDMSAGPNVDIVTSDPFNWPVEDNKYDVVISGQCMEHVTAPWLWIKEVERICKPGGTIAIIAPAKCVEHRYPVDCWRVLPDGMRYLLTEWCKLEVFDIGMVTSDASYDDCYAFAKKPVIIKSINDIYNQVINYPVPPYDHRLNGSMTEEEYLKYQNNTGHTYYMFLNKLVHILKPKNVVELGTAVGRSALFMMLALPEDGKLVTIDKIPYITVDLMNFKDDPRLVQINGNTLDSNVYGQVPYNIDLLYVDSDHNHNHVRNELMWYQPKLRNGAMVVMDDIHISSGMTELWDSLPYDKIDVGSHIHSSGFGIFQFNQNL